MNDMTYIMSGASMALKPGMGDKQDGDIYSGMVADTIKEFDSGVNYEIMFNAYNEVNAMVNYFSKYNYFGTKWHADSGGLQMITLGKEITEELKEKIYDIVGEFNINSTQQLGVALNEQGIFSPENTPKGAQSWGESALVKIDHPVAGYIRQYRTLEKLRSTYLEPHLEESVIHTGFLSSVCIGLTNPSLLSAHFKIIYGRFFSWKVKKRLLISLHSSSNTPIVTLQPASRSFFTPRPQTFSLVSRVPITTFGILFSIIKSAHGGVFPK